MSFLINMAYVIGTLVISGLLFFYTGMPASEPHILKTNWPNIPIAYFVMLLISWGLFGSLARKTNEIVFTIASILFFLVAALGLRFAIELLFNSRHYPYGLAVPISNLLFLAGYGFLFSRFNPYRKPSQVTQ